MTKAILRQNIGVIKEFLIDGEGFAIVQQEILEVDTDMTVRELMQKCIGKNTYSPNDHLKDSEGNIIYRYERKDTMDCIKLKWMKPVNEEWDVEETS